MLLLLQLAAAIEQGKFHLHKVAQPIGEERYTISADSGGGQRIAADFQFLDRNTQVPLMGTLRLRAGGDPWHFELMGKTSRSSRVDVAVDIRDNHADVRTDGVRQTRPLTPGARVFTIDGYAPVVMQQELVRYWLAHGTPDSLATLPTGTVRISRRGIDTVAADAGARVLTRYSVQGLVWGRETLWLDDSLRAVAVITLDAELDHFEAVRNGYESLLGRFIPLAATDALAVLTDITTNGPAADADPFAIVGADLIDGTGAPPVPDAVVVVREGRIVAAGPRAHTPIPRDAEVIDGHGKTVMPGLWDMHAHYEQVEWGAIYLASGITTVRDVGNELEFIKAVRDAVRAGRGIGPRLLLAGVIDGSGPAALGVIRADTPDEGRARVQRYHDAGFDQIKIYSSVKLDVLRAICDEAHRLGMSVTGHIPTGLTVYDGVNAGMDQVNHIAYLSAVMGPPIPPTPPAAAGAGLAAGAGAPEPAPLHPAADSTDRATAQLVAFLLAHHTVLDPTLALFEWLEHPASQPVSEFEPGIVKVAPELAEPLTHTGAPPQLAARAASIFARDMGTARIMHRAGVPIVAGTDQTVPGYSLHRELELYVQAGFTPMEAIQAATIVPARVMHLDGEVGTVTPGKRADLVLIDGHPLQRIADTRNVALVVTNGRRYLPAPLWRSVEFTP